MAHSVWGDPLKPRYFESETCKTQPEGGAFKMDAGMGQCMGDHGCTTVYEAVVVDKQECEIVEKIEVITEGKERALMAIRKEATVDLGDDRYTVFLKVIGSFERSEKK